MISDTCGVHVQNIQLMAHRLVHWASLPCAVIYFFHFANSFPTGYAIGLVDVLKDLSLASPFPPVSFHSSFLELLKIQKYYTGCLTKWTVLTFLLINHELLQLERSGKVLSTSASPQTALSQIVEMRTLQLCLQRQLRA